MQHPLGCGFPSDWGGGEGWVQAPDADAELLLPGVQRVMKSFVSDPGVLCLPSATMKLRQANLLGCKQTKISDVLQLLTKLIIT